MIALADQTYELIKHDGVYDWWDIKKKRWNSTYGWKTKEGAIASYRQIYKITYATNVEEEHDL